MSLFLGKWLNQSPGLLPKFTHSASGKNLVVNNYKLKKLVWNTRLLYLAAAVLAFTFIVTTMAVNEKSFQTAIVDKLSGALQGTGSEDRYLNKAQCKRTGAEALPKGIRVETSDLQMRSLVDYEEDHTAEQTAPKNLLAMAVGIKQKTIVDEIVQKFPLSNFTIMLFHYDGIVDQWNDLPWSNKSIHIVGLHQTKWWFAKRFMHPDIVAEYNYVFIWDEDFGVENFDANRYLEIMEAEGFEISQPALDLASSDIHHMLTRRKASGRAHTRILAHGKTTCNMDSNGPPCTGYVEVMAPVFSKAAWRCIWHMIQNDLVHGWGVDLKIGYCSGGVRSEKVGVIDAEYILHKGIPSLGGPRIRNATTAEEKKEFKNSLRSKVRKRSGAEMVTFLTRWKQAAAEDASWVDLFPLKNDSSATYHIVR